MPMIEAQVTCDALLSAAEQLDETELRRLTSGVLALAAKRTAASVTEPEAGLLAEINRGLPDEVQRRYEELIARRDAETLTDTEHTELLQLTKLAEARDVERVQALIKLAALRGVPLAELMRQLEIERPANGQGTNRASPRG